MSTGARALPVGAAAPSPARAAAPALALALVGGAGVAAVGPARAAAMLVGAVLLVAVARWAPELFLVTLVLSGPIASSDLGASLPIALLPISLLGIAVALAGRLLRRSALPALPVGVIPFVLIAVMLVLGSLYSPDPAGAVEKATTFQTVSAAAFFAPLLLLDGRTGFRRLCIGLVAVGTFAALAARETGHPSHPLTLPGDTNEITMGLLTGLGLVAIVGYLWPTTPGPWRLVWLPFAAVMAPAFIGAGSRGALAGAAVALLLTLGLQLARPGNRRPAVAILVAAVAVAPVIWAGSPPAAKQKYLSSLQLGQGSDALDAGGGARGEIFSSAVRLFAENPMGVGTNGYPALTGYIWPHNIVLELGAELGIVGVALLAALVVAVARTLARAYAGPSAPEAVGAAGLAALPFTLAFSSYDLNNNRILWIMLGVALAVGAAARRRGELRA